MLDVLYSNPSTPQGGMTTFDFTSRPGMGSRQSSTYSNYSMSREEHRSKELSLLRDSTRSPRRSNTVQDYQIPAPSSFTLHTARQQPPATQVEPPTPPTPTQAPEQKPQPVEAVPTPKPGPLPRPALGPPRRSYSVMDYEPLPHHHRPPPRGSGGLSLMDLPTDLHYTIFDHLDPIDSTCLGLTNSHLYAIHRRLHGAVPLATRRAGPNELEWAWHLHVASEGTAAVDRGPADGPAVFVTRDGSGEARTREEKEQERRTLRELRVRGQAYCRKCGVARCELHKHIQGWMGEGREYCSVRQRFGRRAGEGARSFCYMRSPRDPGRCGRHGGKKDRVVLE